MSENRRQKFKIVLKIVVKPAVIGKIYYIKNVLDKRKKNLFSDTFSNWILKEKTWNFLLFLTQWIRTWFIYVKRKVWNKLLFQISKNQCGSWKNAISSIEKSHGTKFTIIGYRGLHGSENFNARIRHEQKLSWPGDSM